METLTILVTRDHIDRIAKAKNPIFGIAELIWNSVDADAKHGTVGTGARSARSKPSKLLMTASA